MTQFAFFIIAPLFHSRSNGMVPAIGFLAPGLDGHVLELGKSWHFFLGALTLQL
jgi:hypothetical protein